MVEMNEPPNAPPEQCYRILIFAGGFCHEVKEECLREGFEVVLVSNPEEAVQFLRSQDHVDAAIAPAFMEDQTVFDFLLGVRKMPENVSAPIMILSIEPSQLAAFCTPAVETAAKLLGAYKFVTMPKLNSRQVMRELKAMLPDKPSKCQS